MVIVAQITDFEGLAFSPVPCVCLFERTNVLQSQGGVAL